MPATPLPPTKRRHPLPPDLGPRWLQAPLSPAEMRLLAVIRCSASEHNPIVPDIRIRVEKGHIRELRWSRSCPPEGFSPTKALEEPFAATLTSHRAAPGSLHLVRTHVVGYIEHFPAQDDTPHTPER